MKQLWIALLILPIAIASNIETSETTIDLQEDKSTIYTLMTLSPQKEIANLTLIISPDAQNIKITINDEQKTCHIQKEFARCGSLEQGKYNLTITYETKYITLISGENTIIRYTDRLPYPAEKQKISIKLPLGYIVPKEKDKEETFYITPKPTDTYSDGQRIILYFEQQGQEMPISIITRKVIKPQTIWMIIAAIAIATTIILSYIVVHQHRKQPKPAKKKTTIMPTLIDNEQKVVNFLKENGQVWQKQIQHATGFSKAKVSRIIRNLEERGVITKTIYGNTNKIALKVK